LTPVSKGDEESRISCLVLRHGGKRRIHGACLGEREPGSDTQAFCRGIDRNKDIEIAASAEDDEGARWMMRITPLPRDAVGRKTVEPQAQNAL
jgi:hypothetical protein